MITIDDINYATIAEKLLTKIGECEYYNGTMDYDNGSFTAVLRATLIIYRESCLDPADTSRAATRLTDIVPVWWEFHTSDESGEVPNDFCWSELREFMI